MSRREIHARPPVAGAGCGLVGVLVVVVSGHGVRRLAAQREHHQDRRLGAIGTDRPTQAAGPPTRSTSSSSGRTPVRVPATTATPTTTAPWAARTPTPTSSCTCRPTARGPPSSRSPRLDDVAAARVLATAPKDEWRTRQWNQNYRIGGTGCLIRTLEGNTGLFVDHYAVVDFRGFKQMVDALGGVDVCTSEPIDDANTTFSSTRGGTRSTAARPCSTSGCASRWATGRTSAGSSASRPSSPR